ncbi:MAG TPA: cob(I)yrinic acid a,c-diamide adenosyltransferase [Gemmatimonadales bacterium]|nr:cob(I)yrinic acid a,c-diamide adenosyltransferase [Gemmatimonadales bacterium]
MKIYTKTGDGGETGLLGGGRVRKDDPRVAAYGQVDELNAAIGLAIALDPRDFASDILEPVQRDLFTLGAELAAPEPAARERALGGRTIGAPQIEALEREIDAREQTVPPLREFILPGGSPKAAALHLARTICRRAERGVVTLAQRSAVPPAILTYLNRLSDLLFVLARAANAHAGRPDVKW